MARPEGFEPPAFRIGICCDIQLRHGRKFITPIIISYFFLFCKSYLSFFADGRQKKEENIDMTAADIL